MLKSGVRTIHKLISNSRIASRIYLETACWVLRFFPHSHSKQLFLNSLAWTEWPIEELGPRTTRMGNIDIRLVPHLGEFDFDVAINRDFQYEPEVYRFLSGVIEDFDCVIEIGANVGAFTSFFAKHTSRVFAFEPSREAFRRLLGNIQLNELTNVHAFNCAVASESGLLTFFEPEGHLTNGSLDPTFAKLFSPILKSNPVFAVAARDIGSLIEDASRVLIKIDAEGAEAMILEGLSEVIQRFRPTLIIEVVGNFDADIRRVIPSGYEFHNITDSGLKSVQTLSSSAFRDWVLIPDSIIQSA